MMTTPTMIAGYLRDVCGFGFAFFCVTWWSANFCGRRTLMRKIGSVRMRRADHWSSFVQFDIRFYVVALLVHYFRRGSGILFSLARCLASDTLMDRILPRAIDVDKSPAPWNQ